MKTTKEEVLNKMRTLAGQPVIPCVVATVVSVEDNNTCTVRFPDDLELSGIRLKAGIDKSKEYFVMKPRPKSTVLLGNLGRDDTVGSYYVVAVNEVDSIEGLIDKTAFKIDKKAVSIVVDKESILIDAGQIQLTQGDSVLRMKAGDVVLTVNKKVTIKNAATNLQSVLRDIVGLSANMKILTGSPGSISPVAPVLLPDIVAIEQKINSLLDA